LRLRLLAMALLSIAGALILSGAGLVLLFQRHVENRIDGELETYVRQIAGNIAFGPAGEITLSRPPADPRFDQPLSGLYWQVADIPAQGAATGQALRSRSLWDSRLALPQDELDPSTPHRHLLPGPGGATVIVRERSVTFTTEGGKRTLRIAAAIDSADVRAAARDFAGDLVPSLALLGLALLAAAWLQVGVGLRPLESLRQAVGAIRSGARNRLPADFPDEVTPLADEVNSLLDAQDKALERARASAGDLAHGLKTPLTVLGADARALRARGEAEVARSIEDLALTMSRHIERALAQARLRRGRGAATELAPLVDRVASTIRKTPLGAALAWDIEMPPDLRVGIDRDDLAELLGNIIENAAKWAKSRVRASAAPRGTMVAIVVEDDGPGIPEAARRAVLERGVRLDRTTAGSGLGLAIAGDILEACGGVLSLEDSALGGLRAVIALPAAPAGQ
jgi:signal transduction histidine kinase